MKIHYCEQYSNEWIKLRLGIPTASEFHRIITAVKGDLSKSAPKYAYALVAETLLNRPLLAQEANSWAMQRGRELEPAAAAQYAFLTDTEARPVGFITSDDGRIGCSPDRLVMIDGVSKPAGGLEIKCTLDEHHMGIWVDGPGDDYRQQYEGSLLVCDELEWWDLHAYHPELPAATLRKLRDREYQAKLETALSAFLDMRDAMLAKAIASGFFAERLAVAAGEVPVPASSGPALDALFGLDVVQAGVIVAAGKASAVRPRRKPKVEPAVAAKLAEAAARVSQAAEPVAAPVVPAIAETTPATAPAGAATGASSKAPSGKQAALLALLTRPEGATRRDMLAATGAKAGASPATCIKLAELFGYTYVYSKRTADAPTSYRLVRDSGAAGIR